MQVKIAASAAPSSLTTVSDMDDLRIHPHVGAKTLYPPHHPRSSHACTGWQHQECRRSLHRAPVARVAGGTSNHACEGKESTPPMQSSRRSLIQWRLQAVQQSILLQCQGAPPSGWSTCQRAHTWGLSSAASGASSAAPSFSASCQEGTSRPACASISTSAHTSCHFSSVHQHWSRMQSRGGTQSRACSAVVAHKAVHHSCNGAVSTLLLIRPG